MSRKIALALAFVALAAAPATARPAECLVEHNGAVVFSGSCDFRPEGRNGSFGVTDHAKRGAAKVEVTSPGRGLGDVLAFPYGEPVVLDSGRLTFDSGCWENARSRICAW